MLKILFLSLVLSSCGLIERFKTPDQPTDSESSSEIVSTNDTTSSSANNDDLFSQTMNETDAAHNGTDSPTNIAAIDPDLQSLEDEFSAAGPNETKIKESNINVAPAESPVLVEEALPEINTTVQPAEYSEAGEIKTYRVQRGETLMQIAFKLYGDISKWKDIKSMNAGKLSNNSSLRPNTELKYHAPATPFVWNPQGTPHLIKTGETLGTISNDVYATPKKWKVIWENNKPLIKNPNVIYAGFTLYYTNGGMANYVQPKAVQPKKEIVAKELAREAASKEGIVEEVLVQEEVTQSAPKAIAPKVATKSINAPAITISDEDQVDEAIQTLSATKRQEVQKTVENTINAPKDAEIDLINNISVPHESEIAPDIDEEIQTL